MSIPLTGLIHRRPDPHVYMRFMRQVIRCRMHLRSCHPFRGFYSPIQYCRLLQYFSPSHFDIRAYARSIYPIPSTHVYLTLNHTITNAIAPKREPNMKPSIPVMFLYAPSPQNIALLRLTCSWSLIARSHAAAPGDSVPGLPARIPSGFKSYPLLPTAGATHAHLVNRPYGLS